MTILCPNMVRPMSPPPHFGVGLLVCDKRRRLAGTQTAVPVWVPLCLLSCITLFVTSTSRSSACACLCQCTTRRLRKNLLRTGVSVCVSNSLTLGPCLGASGGPAVERKAQSRPVRVVSLRQREIKLIDFHEDG